MTKEQPPAAETSAAETSAAETSAAETSAAETSAAETSAAETSAAETPEIRRMAGPLELVLLGLALLAAVGAAVLVLTRPSPPRLGLPQAAAVAAARQAAVEVTSFDHSQLDQQVARVAKLATGDFAAEFARTKADLITTVKNEQRVSSSHVVEAGLVSSSAREATVLLAVDELRKTKAAAGGTTLRYRMQMQLRLVSGRWLLAELRPVT